MNEHTAFDELNLDDVIYESYPWDDGRVFERRIAHVAVHTEKRSFFSNPATTWRKYWTDEGGILGCGEEIKRDDWLKKYFPTREMARRDCVTRRVKLREEHLAELESEQVRLSDELDKVKSQLAPKATR